MTKQQSKHGILPIALYCDHVIDNVEKAWCDAFYNEFHVESQKRCVRLTEALLNLQKMIQIMLKTFNIQAVL